MELVFEVDWNVYRNAFASRSRCACMSEEILVVLAVLIFELWAQTNCKDISLAKEFATANEIQCPAEIVRIKHFDPLPKIGRKEAAILKIAMEPERAGIKLNLISSKA